MGDAGMNGESRIAGLRAAEKQLDQLAGKFIKPRFTSRIAIRVGTPAEEILAEVRQSKVNLIVLTSYGDSSLWKRPIRSKTVQTVLAAAPCDITLLPVRTWFNCEQQWELVDEIVRALDYVGLLRPRPKHSQVCRELYWYSGLESVPRGGVISAYFYNYTLAAMTAGGIVSEDVCWQSTGSRRR